MNPAALRMIRRLGAFVMLAGTLKAQDVTMTPPEWTESEAAPDELPSPKGSIKFSYPRDLVDAPEPGYVAAELYFDEKGRYRGGIRPATLPVYETVFNEALAGAKWLPGRRGGKPVNTHVKFAVIFNPKSASETGPEAIPRLLRAEAIENPMKEPVNNHAEPRILAGTLRIDENGQPVEVRDVPEPYATAIRESLSRWKFAPARHAGKDVAADLHLSFLFIGRSSEERGKGVPPRPVHSVPPQYPTSLRAAGLRGEVLVDFVVDIEGRVRNAFVVRSLNPAFDEPALESVRQWRFAPGEINGHAVNTHMQVPVIFQLNDMADGGDAGMEVQRRGRAKMPETFRYDVPPKALATARVVFPYPMLKAHRDGEATVKFVVNEQGKVAWAQVDSADSPEFGAATMAAVECFEFEPALKKGRPIRAALSFTGEFKIYGSDASIDSVEFGMLRDDADPGRVALPNQLDARLKPISQKPPHFPISAAIAGTDKGEAMLEVLIDQEGRVRLPRIVSASAPEFGYAAIQAITAWRFEPPRRGGKATTVRVRVPFGFKNIAPQPRSESETQKENAAATP